MTPAEPRRYRRRNFRRILRGIPTGRGATHPVETAYGRRQKARDRAAGFSAWCAERRETAAITAEKKE
ncbi:MAG TPA: hypothetical protein VKU39_06460 [Streptosporangiaceae bacterium]|nr:hypothetical protein [Streptosporangiaceae bacterium]